MPGMRLVRGAFKGFCMSHLPLTLTLLGVLSVAGIADAQGVDGKKGETGKPSERTTVIVTPAPETPPAK